MSKRILVPLDGSKHSEKVVRVACELARARDASLVLLHVVPSGSMPEGLQQWAEVEHIHVPPSQLYEQNVGSRILETFRDQATKLGVSDVALRVESGNPVKCILDTATTCRADTLVMGSRGLSDLEGLVFGSVAHRVTHGAPCDVVTVR
jgi:nucleotide-binding universal stress UspA family protein